MKHEALSSSSPLSHKNTTPSHHSLPPSLPCGWAFAFASARGAAVVRAMARAPGGVRRRSGRRGAGGGGAGGGGEALRKGPWMAEEDEVLLEHVRTHGPMDWSSIRSKGLLPRTGKSCRLRWVNKLRPNLKR